MGQLCTFFVQIDPLTWPSGKLPIECKKIAKNLTFFFNCQKLSLKKKLPLAMFLKKKNDNFWQYLKNVKFLVIFDIQLAIFRRVSHWLLISWLLFVTMVLIVKFLSLLNSNQEAEIFSYTTAINLKKVKCIPQLYQQ